MSTSYLPTTSSSFTPTPHHAVDYSHSHSHPRESFAPPSSSSPRSSGPHPPSSPPSSSGQNRPPARAPFQTSSYPSSSSSSASHPAPPPPSQTSPTHSLSSSVSSSSAASATSPMFADSRGRRRSHHTAHDAGGEAGGGGPGEGGQGSRTPRSHNGSVGSLATTVSSGGGSPKPAREEQGGEADTEMRQTGGESEDERRAADEGSEARRGLANLSMRDADEPPNPNPSTPSGERSSGRLAPEGHTGKVRRASTLSSSSSSTAAAQTPGIGVGAGDEGGKSGRRKAARMGSFYGSGSSPGLEGEGETEDEADGTGANTSPTEHHVDIVSYPSAELLRLLATLLEQIAQSNDARNARVAAAQQAASSAPPPSQPAASSSAPRAPATPAAGPSRRGSVDADFSQGRFDAAPLNTPVTPRFRRRLGGAGGPGILDNALDYDEAAYPPSDDEEGGRGADELPLTPGVDLLRETGDRGPGVEGFMPSLGGTHRPQPLSRRRGSSFIRNKRDGDAGQGGLPAFSRRGTAGAPPPAASSGAASQTQGQGQPQRPPPAPTGSSPASSSFTTLQSGSASSSAPPLTALLTASAVALSSPSSTLCFHARNVPAISIEAYLLRILKYCPTTNEVFLALLVYFDRMARIGLEAQRMGLAKARGGASAGSQAGGAGAGAGSQGGAGAGEVEPHKLFAIDSFNVHRLVIAGVTVASKFFSDVFYTNSRYAKVGGLPLSELNQLELQFLLLNDFRLKIPTDELQRYADQLVLYWVGREGRSSSSSSTSAPLAPPTPHAAPVPPTPTAGPSIPSAAPPTPAHIHPPPVARPRSERAHPSHSSSYSVASSSTSVSSSTVTPGTPSEGSGGTWRGSSASEGGSDGEEEREDGEGKEGEVGMEED